MARGLAGSAFMTVKIYHNPRCSKSRQTLALLQERGLTPEVVLYLQTPPELEELRHIIRMLGIDAHELMRKGEDAFARLAFDKQPPGEDEVLQALMQYPMLLQRPIVINGQRARIGRPPESVLEILE